MAALHYVPDLHGGTTPEIPEGGKKKELGRVVWECVFAGSLHIVYEIQELLRPTSRYDSIVGLPGHRLIASLPGASVCVCTRPC